MYKQEMSKLNDKSVYSQNIECLKQRKNFFSKTKRLEGSLEPILLACFEILSSDYSEIIKILAADNILDIQEVLKKSICKGTTLLGEKSVLSSQRLNIIYNECQSLTLKFKITALKIVMEECFSFKKKFHIFPDVDEEIPSCVEEILKIMTRNNQLHKVIILDMTDEKTFAIFDSKYEKVLFLKTSGIVLETAVQDIKRLRRGDLSYLCIQGTNHSFVFKSCYLGNF